MPSTIDIKYEGKEKLENNDIDYFKYNYSYKINYIKSLHNSKDKLKLYISLKNEIEREKAKLRAKLTAINGNSKYLHINNNDIRPDSILYLSNYKSEVQFIVKLKLIELEIENIYNKYIENYEKWEESLPVFKFIAKSPGYGIDPECMLISTSKFIIVAFRGTDRVSRGQAGGLEWEWGEWFGTNLNITLFEAPLFRGSSIHFGMWNSLETIKSKIDEFIEENNKSKSKTLWVTGHSL
ncbi:MAG: hypothetical protein IPL31_04670 [Saprospiraceae bacterium]|nr:hypothetical protein [Saprospiraceae bacterium]